MGGQRHYSQRGYALLLMVLLLMGAGGIALASFTQQARQETEEQRYEHNKRVLLRAKQALLMFAYNYPQTNPGQGPGRLPCPDHNNDGLIGAPPDCSLVGRFPWRDDRLNVASNVNLEPPYHFRDASGETLWYAVSNAFGNDVAGVINSDTTGQMITLKDRSGAILYDGTADGIAALIIAPGPIVGRDEDNDVNSTYEIPQLRNIPAQQIDPSNYLDTYNGIDNSVFASNSTVDADSFVLGPIVENDPSSPQFGTVVVNDQMIVVTADEVIAMAEKKVLETYRDALDLYRDNVPPGAGFFGYPWLHGYDDTADLDLYDVPTGKTVGRVPFMNYFLDHDSLHEIVTDLQIDFDANPVNVSMQDLNDPLDQTYIDEFSTPIAAFLTGPQNVDITRARISFEKTTFDGSADNITDDIGTMIVSNAPAGTVVNSAPDLTLKRYFWDGCPSCFEAADGWEACPVVDGDGEDCALDAAGTSYVTFTDWSNHADVRIRMVELRVHIDPEFVIEFDYDPAPAVINYSTPTDVAHARFTTRFQAASLTDLSMMDAVETSARNFVDIEVIACDQDDRVIDDLNLFELGNDNSNTIDCTAVAPVLDLATVASQTLNNTVDITLDYHPELPFWVASNDWDNTVMMSYATEYRPDPVTPSTGACTPEDGDPGSGAADDCLVVNNLGGVNNNVISVFVLSGEHGLVDDAPLGNFIDDLNDIFEGENYFGLGPFVGLGLVFDRRESVDSAAKTEDTVFVYEQM